VAEEPVKPLDVLFGGVFGDKNKKDDEAAKHEAADAARQKKQDEVAAEKGDEAAAKAVAAAKAADAAQVDAAAKKLAGPGLAVDGKWGASTTKAVQAALGQPQTGEAWINNSDATVLQQKLGIAADGLFGKGSNTALQNYLGVTADGVFGPNSVKALQERLNAGTFFA
jgi:peptidoglycan hydrolase-like protein with peptidoglycan-binding domain